MILLINTIIRIIQIIKVNDIDVKFNSYAEYNVESNAKDPKFKIFKFKTFLLEDMLLTGQKKFF